MQMNKMTEKQMKAVEVVCEAFEINRFAMIGAPEDFSHTRLIVHQIDTLQTISVFNLEAERLKNLFLNPPKSLSVVKS